MHALLRFFIIIAAYLCGVIGAFAALALLFGLGSLASFAPGYWTISAVSPAIFAGAPLVGLFFAAGAIMLSAIPMMAIAALAEAFKLRSWLLYVLPAAAMGAAIYLVFSPRTIGGLDRIGFFELAFFALSGAFAGSICWGLAGRKAGAWRRRDSLADLSEPSSREMK